MGRGQVIGFQSRQNGSTWDGFGIFLDPKVPKLFDPQGLLFSELKSVWRPLHFFFFLTAPQSPLFLVVVILSPSFWAKAVFVIGIVSQSVLSSQGFW